MARREIEYRGLRRRWRGRYPSVLRKYGWQLRRRRLLPVVRCGQCGRTPAETSARHRSRSIRHKDEPGDGRGIPSNRPLH